jgi:hypothetical protein
MSAYHYQQQFEHFNAAAKFSLDGLPGLLTAYNIEIRQLDFLQIEIQFLQFSSLMDVV